MMYCGTPLSKGLQIYEICEAVKIFSKKKKSGVLPRFMYDFMR